MGEGDDCPDEPAVAEAVVEVEVEGGAAEVVEGGRRGAVLDYVFLWVGVDEVYGDGVGGGEEEGEEGEEEMHGVGVWCSEDSDS